jgi:hypothetical protein
MASEPSGTPVPNNPNAPQISQVLHLWEKSDFLGKLTSSIFYGTLTSLKCLPIRTHPAHLTIIQGIVVALFFQCVGALLNPTNRMGKGARWALMAHTVLMFSFATIAVGVSRDLLLARYIDNRAFPGGDDGLPPGPYGYGYLTISDTSTLLGQALFPLSQWLSDGLLVGPVLNSIPRVSQRQIPQMYRCWVIYSMSYWTMAFPCLMYLGSIGARLNPLYTSSNAIINMVDTATGIAFIYELAQSVYRVPVVFFNIYLSYLSISLSLNVLLTIMIVARLLLHRRNIQNAIGDSAEFGGLYDSIITTIVESYAPYTVVSLINLALFVVDSPIQDYFGPALGHVQVCDVVAPP